MKKSNQNGSAMVVLVVVLALAVLGLVAKVVYDNYFVKKSVDSKTETSQTDNNQPKEMAKKEACAKNEKLCFKYPEGWESDYKEVQYPPVEKRSNFGLKPDQFAKLDQLTFKKGDVSVAVFTGIDGIGGVCTEENFGKSLVVSKKKTDIKVDGNDLYAIATVIHDKVGNKFVPAIGLTDKKDVISGENDSGCVAMFFGMFKGKNVDLSVTGSDASGSVQVSASEKGASIDVQDNIVKSKGYASLDEAKKVLESKDYKQAFEIVASAHYN